MDVVVLGGGVIGVTTAHFLSQRGARVTLIERQPGVADETSFANAGQVSAGYATPWAAPGMPSKALKWLWQAHAPLRIRPDGTLFQLAWLWNMWRECRADRYEINKTRMMRLAEYSRDALRRLQDEVGLDFEGRRLGTLQLFRTESQLEIAARDMPVLASLGVPHRLLDATGLREVEPALARSRVSLAGGLHLPNDDTGDCRLFTQALARRLEAHGVALRFGLSVDRLETRGRRVTAVHAGGKRFAADHVVVAMGSYSRALLLQLQVDVPVYPVKGYSLTMPLTDPAAAPVSTVLDETHKVALTRFDRRLRVGGMAELGGFDLRLDPRRRLTLEKVTRELFPEAAAPAEGQFWTGLRPMTPDGTPLVGPTHWSNLWTNTGHGTLGWTMACGSGELLADLMTGRVPAIDPEGLSVFRYAARRHQPAAVGVPSVRTTAGRPVDT